MSAAICLISSVFRPFLLPAVRCQLQAGNLAWFLLVVSDSFALKYEQVKFRE
jgi:hypothetical protein